MIYLLMTILDIEVGAENIHMAKSSSTQPMILKNTECPQKKFLIKLITGSRFPTFASLNTCRFTEGGKHVDLFSDCAIRVHFTGNSVRNFILVLVSYFTFLTKTSQLKGF